MNQDPVVRVESLLRIAREREQPSVEGMERAREAARASWQRALAAPASSRPARPTRRGWLAVAAAAGVLSIASALSWWRASTPIAPVARVAHTQGQANLAGAAAPLAASTTLRSGDLLITGDGLVALVLGDTLSLRVGRGSRLRFDGPGEVTLIEGAVYVDSGGLHRGATLRIETPAGEVRHVGTQFQVQVRRHFTSVQVREGRVVMTMSGRPAMDLAAGDLAEVDGGELRLRRGLPSFGEAWEWAAMTHVGFDIENRPLSEFLAWLAREHGWQLRYVGTATPERALQIRLHGSMESLDAVAMIERASLVTGVPLMVRNGVLWAGEATQ